MADYDEYEERNDAPASTGRAPSTFTPRGPSKGFMFDQLDAFQHMQALGADFVSALTACLSGKRMTQDLAAQCISTYWKRYAAVVALQESRGATITLQAAVRRMLASNEYRYQMSLRRAAMVHESSGAELFLAAQKLQAVWRGHLAHAYVAKLKYKKMSLVKRTFSWSNKSKRPEKKAAGDVIEKKSAKEILAAAGVEDSPVKKPVKRSMSFDRFSNAVKAVTKIASGGDGESKPDPPTPIVNKQLLFIVLHRGPKGLGLELDATNTVVNMVPGGAAEVQGYFQEGDTIASVDGMPLRGRLLQDVMDRSKNSYSFDVWRLSRVEPDPPKPKLQAVRRAFSFDRKKK